MSSLELPVIVIGGGGHAKVLISTLQLSGRKILGFTDLNPDASPILGVNCLSNDEALLGHAPQNVELVNGIGSTGSTMRRRGIYERFTEAGYRFASVIHPAAILVSGVQIEDGVQVMAGAVVQTGCRLGSNAIINTGARIDHDCTIGSHVHIAPGATLCGAVNVGSDTHIGAGATVIQGIQIGSGCIVGAGALVIREVPHAATVVGVPAVSIANKGRRDGSR